jgi:hypothetical protein
MERSPDKPRPMFRFTCDGQAGFNGPFAGPVAGYTVPKADTQLFY